MEFTLEDVRNLMWMLCAIYAVALSMASVLGYQMFKLVMLPAAIAGGYEENRYPVPRIYKYLRVAGLAVLLLVMCFCVAGTGGWIAVAYARLHGHEYVPAILFEGMAYGLLGCLLVVLAMWRGAKAGNTIAFALSGPSQP